MRKKHKENCNCASCKSKRGEMSGKNNGMFNKKHSIETRHEMSIKKIIHGKTLKKNKCIDCGKKISGYSKRCKLCSNKNLSKKRHKKGCKCFKCTKDGGFRFHKINCQCIICKTIRKEAHNKNCKCCSCASRRGEYKECNNGRWNNGSSNLPYSFNFNNELKEKIRKRDNYTCQLCGMIEEESLNIWNEVLNIHHIDYDKFNCEEKNLISLCRRCNSKVNTKRKYWKKYFEGIICKNE